MPRTPTAQQIFDALLTKYGKQIAAAFRAAIDDLRSGVDLTRLIQAISRNDINAAVDALHLDPAAMQPIREAISSAYRDGGTATINTLPLIRDATGAKVVLRFNPGSQRAADWVVSHSDRLTQYFLQDQAQGMTESVRAGLEAGRHPRSIALDIAGRINRVTGIRENGLIGLSRPQTQYVRSAQAELGSTDTSLLRNYLKRNLRDKAFDKTVLKAIDSGEPIPAGIIERASGKYASNLLRARGELVAKEEAFSALGASKHGAYQQIADKGVVSQSAITKKWRHFPNEHPRLQHIEMSDKTVGLNEPFRLPDGTLMMFPHDPSAPIDQTAGCHCQADYHVDFLASVL